MTMSERLYRLLDRLTTVVVLVAACAVLWRVTSAESRELGRPPNQPAPVENLDEHKIEIRLNDASLPAKSLAIVEFSDYQCPYCGKHARETLPELRKQFVDSGKAQYVFMNLPLESIHPLAFDAAKTAECARRQGRFWDLHDWLFENQTGFSEGKLSAKILSLGLKQETLNKCVEEIDTEIRAEMREASKLGIQSTPTFFLGEIGPGGVLKVRRRINGAASFDMFKAELDALSEPRPSGIWQRLTGGA